MLARLVPGLEGRLPRPLQASLRLPSQTPSSIRCANDLHLAEAYAGLTGTKNLLNNK
jgi:hypothetical protein